MSETQKHTKPNVPNLRFPGFEGEWKNTLLKNECVINPKTCELEDKFLYIDLESVVKGQLVKHNVISKAEAPSRAQRVLSKWDILYQCVRPYQLNNYIVRDDYPLQRVASTGYAQIRTNHNPDFFFQLLHTKKFTDQVINRCTGTNYPAINSTDLGEIGISVPGIKEQRRIAELLTLIDRRIAIQSKVIEKYESLIKALCQILITPHNGTICHIGDVLKIGSGKDYKHLNTGTIPVLGTGGYMLSVNDWLYEGESVCIGRKGTINNPFFVEGKFWTVDTLFYTYDFKGILPKYCYYLFQTIDWLQYNEASGVPSLSKSTIERIQIHIPCMDEQTKAVQVLDRVEMAITCGRELLNHYKSIKQYLLSQLFK